MTPRVYDREYFDKYVGYAQTEMGRRILARRLDLVSQFVPPSIVVDVGIGSGAFVEAAECWGYDVGAPMIEWLKKRGSWRNVFADPVLHVTCWDSLEHIANPLQLVKNVGYYLFVSLPIFSGREHALRSKHFRPDEHYWYFTDAGIRLFFRRAGFRCVEVNRMEEDCGREDIGTYVFKRKEPFG